MTTVFIMYSPVDIFDIPDKPISGTRKQRRTPKGSRVAVATTELKVVQKYLYTLICKEIIFIN